LVNRIKRFYVLLTINLCLVFFAVGCNQGEPDQSRYANVKKTPAPQVDVDPWAATLSEITELAISPDDERDSNGQLIAISLRGKDVTLTDLAKTEDAKSLQRVNAHSGNLSEADMAAIAMFPNLKTLKLNVNNRVTDESLRCLKNLEKLQVLSLFFCTELNGSGFVHLTELDSLANLNIGNNKNISDKSLSCLSELKGLRILLASSLNGITDEGVKHLSKIENLRRLQLSGDRITDAGLMYLASLKNLEILTLSRNHTEEAIENLKKAMPNCTI